RRRSEQGQTSSAGSIASTSGCSVASIEDGWSTSSPSTTSSGSCSITSRTSTSSSSASASASASGSKFTAATGSCTGSSFGSLSTSGSEASAWASSSGSGSATTSLGWFASAWCAGTPHQREPGSAAFGQRLPFERIAPQRPETSP